MDRRHEKGGKDLGTATFAFTTDSVIIATVDGSGTTLGAFLDFLDGVLPARLHDRG
jgi:hypothetical protein